MNFGFGNPSESLKCAYQQFCRQDAEQREHDQQFLAKLQKFESKTVELGTQTQLARQMKNQYEKIVMQQNPLLWAKVQQSLAKFTSFKIDKLAGTRTRDVAINTHQEISSASDQDSLHEGVWPHTPSPEPVVRESKKKSTKPEELKEASWKLPEEQHSLKFTNDEHFNRNHLSRQTEEEHSNNQHSLKLGDRECVDEQLPPKAERYIFNDQQSPKLDKGNDFTKQISPPANFKYSPEFASTPYDTKRADDSSFPITHDKSLPELTTGKKQDILISNSTEEVQENIQPPPVSVPVAPAVESKTFRLDSDSESTDVISGPKNEANPADEESDSFWS